MHEVTIRRLNDDQDDTAVAPEGPIVMQPGPSDTTAPKLDPARWRWRRQKYARHQNTREAMRRLRQVARRQLSGSVVSPGAAAVGARVRLIYAATAAELACHNYINEAITLGEEDRLPGRDHLFVAVSDLARWLRGDEQLPNATCTTSAVGVVPVRPTAIRDRGDDIAA